MKPQRKQAVDKGMRRSVNREVQSPFFRSVLSPNVPGWKRRLDLFCLVLAAPALLPLMLLIALAIKLASPGPVLFRQERVGFLGRPFTLFKFRSMKMKADTGIHVNHMTQLMQSDAPMKKMDKQGDPRLIPLGWLFRASGLDELPQVFNVFRGEMSLVGPRPCTPYEFERYLPWQKQRFATLPGLTGLWQVSGKNNTTFTEMINLDIYYAKHVSFWQDLMILGRTVPALVNQIRDTHPGHTETGRSGRSLGYVVQTEIKQ